jgi:hypothetical protein
MAKKYNKMHYGGEGRGGPRFKAKRRTGPAKNQRREVLLGHVDPDTLFYSQEPGDEYEIDEKPEVDPRDWYKGTKGITKDEALADLLAGVSTRIHPTVDVEFLRKYLLRFAHAMASERWDMLFAVCREAARESETRRKVAPTRSEILDMRLEMTSIGERTLGWLHRDGVFTIHDLLNKTRSQLMAIPQFGPHCLQECMDALAAVGFKPE